MARCWSVGFACSYHWYAYEHSLVFYHLRQAVIGHIADYAVKPLPFSPSAYSCEVSQDVRIGGKAEADYPFADSVKDGVNHPSLLATNSFYDLSEASLLEPSTKPSVMASNSPYLLAKELSLHHALTPQHRCSAEAFTQIHGKDRGASTHGRASNSKVSMAIYLSFLLRILLSQIFPFGNSPCGLIGTFIPPLTPYTGIFRNQNALAFLMLIKSLLKLSGYSFCLTFLYYLRACCLLADYSGTVLPPFRKLWRLAYSVQNLPFPSSQPYDASLNSQLHGKLHIHFEVFKLNRNSSRPLGRGLLARKERDKNCVL